MAVVSAQQDVPLQPVAGGCCDPPEMQTRGISPWGQGPTGQQEGIFPRTLMSPTGTAGQVAEYTG